MIYPMLKPGVDLGTFVCEDTEEEGFFLSNEHGEEHEIPYELFCELMKADGSHKLRLPKNLILDLEEEGILSTGRFVKDGWINRYILFVVGGQAKAFRPVCRWINILLPYGAVFLFLLGVLGKLCVKAEPGGHLILSLYYGMLIASMVAHECGHMTAAVASGCRVTDMGILLLGPVPVGAYTAYQQTGDRPLREKIQLSLAGIEVNLMLAGLFFLISLFCPGADTWRMAAEVNIVLVLLNLLPVQGLDGECVVSDLFGVESIGALAWKSLTDRRKGERFLRSGPIGWLCLAFCAFLCLLRLVLFLLIAFNGLYGVWLVFRLIGLIFL